MLLIREMHLSFPFVGLDGHWRPHEASFVESGHR